MSLITRILKAIRNNRRPIVLSQVPVALEQEPEVELSTFSVKRWDVAVYENGVLQPMTQAERQEIVDEILFDALWWDVYGSPPLLEDPV